jgi:hypothetical protein
MQIPLSQGGLSLRLPSSIYKIAYVSSCLDCLRTLSVAASILKLRDCAPYRICEFQMTRRWIVSNISTITENTFALIEQELDSDYKAVTAQQELTALLNKHQIEKILHELKPVPMYFRAFQARTDARQDHSSWPFNPVVRAHFSIGPIPNSEFSRAIQLATLRPAFDSPGWCIQCCEELDPVGMHLLKCKSTHFTDMHNSTKHAVAQRLRSLMTAQMAALSVHVEKPISRWCKLLPQYPVETTIRIADIVVLLSGLTQQDVIITDIVSTLCRTPNASDGFYHELNRAETIKYNTYRMYDIKSHHFFPLAFGRTNILSRETLRFCDFVGNYFPKSLRVADRLRATFSRSIAAGVASTFNACVRRHQLAAANLSAFSMIPPVPDLRRSLSLQARLAQTQRHLNRVSSQHLPAHFADIIARGSSNFSSSCGIDGSLHRGLCDP